MISIHRQRSMCRKSIGSGLYFYVLLSVVLISPLSLGSSRLPNHRKRSCQHAWFDRPWHEQPAVVLSGWQDHRHVSATGRARGHVACSARPERTTLMNIASTLLLAVAMSTDAFAAAVGKGATLHRPHSRGAPDRPYLRCDRSGHAAHRLGARPCGRALRRFVGSLDCIRSAGVARLADDPLGIAARLRRKRKSPIATRCGCSR